VTLTRTDLYAVARLMANKELNGELKLVTTSLRPLVDHLGRLGHDARGPALEAFLCSPGVDRELFVRAIADIDPLGPTPETEDGPGVHEESSGPRYRMRCAADITPQPVEWLWKDRVPLGMLTLFAGDPKLGKSFVTVAMTASVSRGAALPGSEPPNGPGKVVLLSAEDDASRTIVPRLKSAGAILGNVHLLESVIVANGAEALPSLRVDVDAIEQAASSLGDCKLIIVDPVSAYLGGADDHNNAELRGVLSPLKAMAERTGAAIVLVTHLNKGSGVNGKHRVTGSIAYVGACRANFLFAREKDDPTGRRVLMLDNGCNLADSVPTLAYQIEDRGEGPAVEWAREPVSVTTEAALAAESESPDERYERRECDKWLREVLAGGPVLQTEIETMGRDAGFRVSALNRAKQRIGARTDRDGFGKGSKCYWTLGGAGGKSSAGAP